MRTVLAAVIDVALASLAGYLAFSLAFHLIPCADTSECPPLAPGVVLAVIVAIGLYFSLPYWAWRRTVGQRVTGASGRSSEGEDRPKSS